MPIPKGAPRQENLEKSIPRTIGARQLMVSIGLVSGALAIAAGVALLAVGVIGYRSEPDRMWGWVGGALGCAAGGAGALLGSWNTYRQMEGSGDLLEQPGWTWLDWVIAAWGLLGVMGMASGLILSPWVSWTSAYALLLIGGILTFQGALFLVIRGLMRRAARQERTDSAAKS